MIQLTVIDARALRRLEKVIAKGLATFVEVGNALAEIRERRLYRATHQTFDAYCQERWDFSGRHGHRLIRSAHVVDNLGPIGHTLNESQARALAAAPPAVQRQVVAEAGASATAAELETLAEQRAEEIRAAEAEADRERPSLDRPQRDRLRAIRGKLEGALKLVDGSIDLADRLEEKIRDALDVLESCSTLQLAA